VKGAAAVLATSGAAAMKLQWSKVSEQH